jgi:hypothetical protein
MKTKKGKNVFKLKTQKARQHEQVWHHEKARQKAEKRAARLDWTEIIRNQDSEYCFVSNISVKYVNERSGKDARQGKHVNKLVCFQSRRYWIWLVVGLLH